MCTAETGYEGLLHKAYPCHSTYCLTPVFGAAPKTTYVLKGDYSHQTAHFLPVSFGSMFELKGHISSATYHKFLMS